MSFFSGHQPSEWFQRMFVDMVMRALYIEIYIYIFSWSFLLVLFYCLIAPEFLPPLSFFSPLSASLCQAFCILSASYPPPLLLPPCPIAALLHIQPTQQHLHSSSLCIVLLPREVAASELSSLHCFISPLAPFYMLKSFLFSSLLLLVPDQVSSFTKA